jgi:hypothetical protein
MKCERRQSSVLKLPGLRKCILPALAIALCACGRVHDMQTGSDGASAAVDGGEPALVSAENGKTITVAVNSGQKATYPGDMPFAQYPGSTVSLTVVRPGKAHEAVSLETADSPPAAVAYYKNWFIKNGWNIAQESSTPGLETISARNGDRLASIMSMPGTGASGQNSIQITLSSNR